jgi:hypothetical protein
LETPARKLYYTEYDRIPIPQDIPDLGIQKGAEGVIRSLRHHRNGVHAAVQVTYSTNQPRGWVDLQVVPEEKVSSYIVGS